MLGDDLFCLWPVERENFGIAHLYIMAKQMVDLPYKISVYYLTLSL